MTTSICARCNTPTDPQSLSMSLDGQGMICQACSIGARATQEKAGMRKAYLTGALIVGLFLLYVAWHITIRMR
jgi:recombinational DNA repair protein (RecF pathway)